MSQIEGFIQDLKLETLFTQCMEYLRWLLAYALPEPLITLISMAVVMAAVIVVVLVSIMYMTLLERKLVGRFQDRYGPNRVGPLGLLQPIADGIKLVMKEDIVPEGADKILHFVAPLLVIGAAVFIYAVIPFGNDLAATDISVAVLFFMGVSAFETLAVIIAGWASHNKFTLLGGMRGAAQIISFEVPMVLSLVVVVMMAGTMSLIRIADAQAGYGWYILTPWGFTAFIIFTLAAMSELNRSPFDMPEAESELVAGYHTEYSGIKFALFYMAEYISMLASCLLIPVLFLGGGDGPALLPSWVWLPVKAFILMCVMMWVRSTLPRLRIDQLMGFSWKFLLPLALLNIFFTGLWFFLPWALWQKNLLGFALAFISYVLLSAKEINNKPATS
jgi:NADH-quinone oxidoreductase subunit H